MDQIKFRRAYGLVLLCIMQCGTGLGHDSVLPCTYWPLYRNAWQEDLQRWQVLVLKQPFILLKCSKIRIINIHLIIHWDKIYRRRILLEV